MEATKVLAPTELSWINLQIESPMMRIHNNPPVPNSLNKNQFRIVDFPTVNFSTVFKTLTGVSPTEFIKKNR